MKTIGRIAVLASAIMLARVFPADAAIDCPQGHAVYQDSSGKFELLFQPKTPETDNTIELVELATDARFGGTIKWNMGFAVPNVRIDYPCGSGADDNQCHYQAVVYALAIGNGRLGAAPMLPADDEQAIDTLLLPDLSRHWHYNVKAQTNAIPDDVFRLTRCHQS